MPQTALVAVRSDIRVDPRVRRQIDWLASEGWAVDTIGLGAAPDGVRDHFELRPQAAWTAGKLGRALMHATLPNRSKFGILITRRVPPEAKERIRRGGYDLIVFNDIDFAAWVADRATFTPAALGAHLHLDLHEYFPPHLPPGSRLRFRVDGYHRWLRSFIGHPAYTTRSTVAGGIADAYAEEFGFGRPALIRNAPPYLDQAPTPVDDDRIRLIHHGVAQWQRGLREVVDAMRVLEHGYDMTFMLAGSSAVIDELRTVAADIADRVHIVPPAAMADLSRVVNQYDLEVMFYPPRNENLKWALPNKLFEAVQGRLGLVIGPSPMMAEIVETYGNGVVATGWTPAELATAIAGLTPARVREFKAASDRAAHELSAEHERDEFLRVVGLR
jgi:glycosyltransferase involved in cell wall biosynthesis